MVKLASLKSIFIWMLNSLNFLFLSFFINLFHRLYHHHLKRLSNNLLIFIKRELRETKRKAKKTFIFCHAVDNGDERLYDDDDHRETEKKVTLCFRILLQNIYIRFNFSLIIIVRAIIILMMMMMMIWIMIIVFFFFLLNQSFNVVSHSSFFWC